MIQTLDRFQFAIGTMRYHTVDSFSTLVFPEQGSQVNVRADDSQIVFNNRKRQASELHNDSEFCLTSALYIRWQNLLNR